MREWVGAESTAGGTGNWSSHLAFEPGRDGCLLYELCMGVHITTVPAGNYTFEATLSDGATTTRTQEITVQIAPWTDTDVDNFYTAFEDAVYVGWNDKLWLAHSGPVTGCHHGYTSTFENLKCAIRLWRETDVNRAQLRVLMLYNPTRTGADGQPIPTHWRSNCARGGRSWNWFGFGDNPVDMKVASADTQDRTLTWPTSTGSAPFTQCVVQHEFGHYIGLPHRCAAEGGLNSDAQYCIGGPTHKMEDMMAVGNVVKTRHATPWLDRISSHVYHGTRAADWFPRTSAPPVTGEACPGPQRGPSMGVPFPRGRR